MFIFFLNKENKFYEISVPFHSNKKRFYKKKLKKIFQIKKKFHPKIFLENFDFCNPILKKPDLFYLYKLFKNFPPLDNPLTRYTPFIEKFRFNLISNFLAKILLEICLNNWKKSINKYFFFDRKLNVLFNFSIQHQIKILNFKKKIIKLQKEGSIWYEFNFLFTSFDLYFPNFQIPLIWEKKFFFSSCYTNSFLSQQIKTIIFFIQKRHRKKIIHKLANFFIKKRQKKNQKSKKNLTPNKTIIFFNGRKISKWLYKLNDYKTEYSCDLCKKKKFRGKRRFFLHFCSKYHLKKEQKKGTVGVKDKNRSYK
jgi:hypothetical protein